MDERLVCGVLSEGTMVQLVPDMEARGVDLGRYYGTEFRCDRNTLEQFLKYNGLTLDKALGFNMYYINNNGNTVGSLFDSLEDKLEYDEAMAGAWG